VKILACVARVLVCSRFTRKERLSLTSTSSLTVNDSYIVNYRINIFNQITILAQKKLYLRKFVNKFSNNFKMTSQSATPLILKLLRKEPHRVQDADKINISVLEKFTEEIKTKSPKKRGRKPKGDADLPTFSKELSLVRGKIQKLSLTKKKYNNWSKLAPTVVDRYNLIRKTTARGALQKTLDFFRARSTRYDDLTLAHIKYWVERSKRTVSLKRGRSCILQESTLKNVDDAILDICSRGTHLVNSTNLYPVIIRAIQESGEGGKIGDGPGQIKVCPTWINDRCRKLKLSMRKPTASSLKIPDDWEEKKNMFVCRLAYWVQRYGLSEDDVYNLDQTAIQFNPHANGGKTRAAIGCKDVVMRSNDDKQQVTVIPTISASGKKCPLQIIFKGTGGLQKDGKKQCRSIPDYQNNFENLKRAYPGSIYAQTSNHWSTADTNVELIEQVIIPFAEENKRARRELGRERHVPDEIVIVLDCWPVQATEDFRNTVRRKFPNVVLAYLPPNLTGKLQPLDVSVNSSFKQQVKTVYGLHFAQKDVNTSILQGSNKYRKSALIEWVHKGWANVKESTVVEGWRKAGLLEAWNADKKKEAMQLMEDGKLFPTVGKEGRRFETQPIPKGFDTAMGQTGMGIIEQTNEFVVPDEDMLSAADEFSGMGDLEEADFESDGGDDVDEVEDVISFQPIERVSRYGRKSTALRRYNA
jgi:hypothetical protein